MCFNLFLQNDKNKKKIIPNFHNKHESTLIQESVHTINFHFHGSARLKCDIYQNGREISHIYYAFIFMVTHTVRKQKNLDTTLKVLIVVRRTMVDANPSTRPEQSNQQGFTRPRVFTDVSIIIH